MLNFHAFVSSSALTEKNKVDFASTPAVPWGRNSMCLICLNWRTALSTSFFYEYISITDRKFKPTFVAAVSPSPTPPTPPILRLIKKLHQGRSTCFISWISHSWCCKILCTGEMYQAYFISALLEPVVKNVINIIHDRELKASLYSL